MLYANKPLSFNCSTANILTYKIKSFIRLSIKYVSTNIIKKSGRYFNKDFNTEGKYLIFIILSKYSYSQFRDVSGF